MAFRWRPSCSSEMSDLEGLYVSPPYGGLHHDAPESWQCVAAIVRLSGDYVQLCL